MQLFVEPATLCSGGATLSPAFSFSLGRGLVFKQDYLHHDACVPIPKRRCVHVLVEPQMDMPMMVSNHACII